MVNWAFNSWAAHLPEIWTRLTFIAGRFPGGAKQWGETGDRCRDGWEQREQCYQNIIIAFRHLATWHLTLHNHKFHVWTMLEPALQARAKPTPGELQETWARSKLLPAVNDMHIGANTFPSSNMSHCGNPSALQLPAFPLRHRRDVSELIFQISALQQVNVTAGATAPPGGGTATFHKWWKTSCGEQLLLVTEIQAQDQSPHTRTGRLVHMSSRILSEHLCQLRPNHYPQFIHDCGTKTWVCNKRTNMQRRSNPPENDWKTGLFTNIVFGFVLII